MAQHRCSRCGEVHEGPPFSYAAEVPDLWCALPEGGRDRRALLGEEQREIDGESFFVRGRLVIPVSDAPHDFERGVWTSLSARNYERMAELWSAAGREEEPPYSGWLSTALPGYPVTLNLKTLIRTQPVGGRPLVELEPTDHPLAIEQRTGITLARVREIAAIVLHG